MLNIPNIFGGAAEIPVTGDVTIDATKGRVQVLQPDANGHTVTLPSVNVYGTTFMWGGAPVLYLINPTAHTINIIQSDIDDPTIVGVMTATSVLHVGVIPAPADGSKPNRYYWLLYNLNTSTNAVFPPHDLGCMTDWRQARGPTDAKSASLKDVWLPVASIPDTGGVDYNFLNLEDGNCYYIHFADPVKHKHGHVPSAWAELSRTNDDVPCQKCIDPQGCGPCLYANSLDPVTSFASIRSALTWDDTDNGVAEPDVATARFGAIWRLLATLQVDNIPLTATTPRTYSKTVNKKIVWSGGSANGTVTAEVKLDCTDITGDNKSHVKLSYVFGSETGEIDDSGAGHHAVVTGECKEWVFSQWFNHTSNTYATFVANGVIGVYINDQCSGQYRQARANPYHKPGPLVNVWIPVEKIPSTHGVDWNFINLEDGTCYYIHFSDPVEKVPGHIPSGWQTISTTDDNIEPEQCLGCDLSSGNFTAPEIGNTYAVVEFTATLTDTQDGTYAVPQTRQTPPGGITVPMTGTGGGGGEAQFHVVWGDVDVTVNYVIDLAPTGLSFALDSWQLALVWPGRGGSLDVGGHNNITVGAESFPHWFSPGDGYHDTGATLGNTAPEMIEPAGYPIHNGDEFTGDWHRCGDSFGLANISTDPPYLSVGEWGADPGGATGVGNVSIRIVRVIPP